MKKVLLMGSMMSDVYGKVTRMPKGNEDFNLLEQKMRAIRDEAVFLLGRKNAYMFMRSIGLV